MAHWLEREIAQWVHHEGTIQEPIALLANALTTQLHLTSRKKQQQKNAVSKIKATGNAGSVQHNDYTQL